MIFRPEMAELILAGRKTQTRRPISDNQRSPWWRERCALEPGRDYAVCPGRGKPQVARIRVTEWLRQQPLYMIDDEEARREGFRSRDDFLGYFAVVHKVYPAIAAHSRTFLEQHVWVVSFELADA